MNTLTAILVYTSTAGFIFIAAYALADIYFNHIEKEQDKWTLKRAR